MPARSGPASWFPVMTAVLPAIALAGAAGSTLAQDSVDPCTVLYEEAKSYDECFAYEAYLEQCPAHVFLPLARTLAARSCRARNDMARMQGRLNDATAEVARLTDLLAAQSSLAEKAEDTLTLLAAAEQVKAEPAGVVEEPESELAEAREEIVRLATRQATTSATLANTESELTDARARLADTEDELTDARDEIAGMATRLAATDDKLAGARDGMARMQSRLDDATAEVTRLTDLLAAQSSLAERQKGELDEARAQLEAGQARLDQSGQDALRLQERIDEQQRMITALSRQRDEAAAQVRQLARLEDNETELRKILALAVEELREARKDREEALAAAESGEQSRLDAEARLEDSTSRLAEAMQRADDAEGRLAEVERRAVDAEEELSEVELFRRLAEQHLSNAQERVLEQSRQITVLNLQINDLRRRLKDLGETLDVARAERDEGEVEIISLGNQLNEALASLAAESSRARQLEIAERERLEREKQELEGFRSEFLGRLRKIMEDTDGVSISGDRFVFAAEVLFPRGEAEMSADGKAQIRNVARLIIELAGEFPERIDWVLRVDGHTDDIPLLPDREFADNWELSQARSLSVVRYLVSELGFPQNRLAAAGFGEFRPVNPARSEAARAQNRRIEFKLTDP